jgi:hypothetical protein
MLFHPYCLILRLNEKNSGTQHHITEGNKVSLYILVKQASSELCEISRAVLIVQALLHNLLFGSPVIWQALKAAAEADQHTSKLILETAGVVVAADDMTVCYDERGMLKNSVMPQHVDTCF